MTDQFDELETAEMDAIADESNPLPDPYLEMDGSDTQDPDGSDDDEAEAGEGGNDGDS